MTDKKVLWIRILIAVAIFLVLSLILEEMILKRVIRSSYRWHPNPIEIILFVISFTMLANGVSYLSEIFNKNKNKLKILTSILSLMIFLITLFPQGQDMNLIIACITFVGLSSSSILISVFSTLEWTQKKLKWLLPFLFATCSGTYSCIIAAFIQRGSNISEGGIALIGYGVVLFIISIIVNIIAISSSKNKIRGNQ